MKALQDFVSAGHGLMSLDGIVRRLGMALFFVRCFFGPIRQDAETVERAARQ